MYPTQEHNSEPVASHSCTTTNQFNMEANNIIEGNKLIAEFMGIRFNDNGTVSHYPTVLNLDMGVTTIESIWFHGRWNLLMPVVEKINKTVVNGYGRIGVIIYTATCHINDEVEMLIETTSAKEGGLIVCVWQAVVEFIKWFNQAHNKDQKTERSVATDDASNSTADNQ